MRKLVLIASLFCSLSLWSQGNLQLIDQYFDSIEKYNQGMGSIAIYQDGKMKYATDYGFALFSPKVSNSKKTLHRIGSISKTFTAVCILQLVEEGKLSLDEKLSRFFPSLPNADKIRIRHLLQHRSGLANFTDSEAFQAFNSQARTRDEHINLYVKLGANFEPDAKFEYSNTGYVLLAFIAEDLEQLGFAKIIEKRITKPLKLKNTRHADVYDSRKNEAHSFFYNGSWFNAPQTHGSIALGGGSLVSNPRELVRFFSALQNGKLLKEETYKMMKEWKEDYGMGLFPMKTNEMNGFGHNGSIDGFQSAMIYYPAENIYIAFCGNGIRLPVKTIVAQVMNFYLGKALEPISFEQTVIKLAILDLEPFVGIYSNEQIGMKITISLKGEQLSAQAEGQGAFPLDAISSNSFVFDPANIKIEFEEKGFILIQNGMNLKFTKQ